jgi:hypothetical protein
MTQSLDNPIHLNLAFVHLASRFACSVTPLEHVVHITLLAGTRLHQFGCHFECFIMISDLNHFRLPVSRIEMLILDESPTGLGNFIIILMQSHRAWTTLSSFCYNLQRAWQSTESPILFRSCGHETVWRTKLRNFAPTTIGT